MLVRPRSTQLELTIIKNFVIIYIENKNKKGMNYMSKQLTELVAELINQGYAFDDIKTELDNQVAAREAEAKRLQEEAMAAQFQAQKIADANILVSSTINFLNTYYPDIMDDMGDISVDGLGEALVKELDESMKMFTMLVKMYAPKPKKDVAPKAKKVDPIADFLKSMGL